MKAAHVVTGFVALPGHPRSADVYDELAKPLRALDVPVTIFRQSVEDCWLWPHVEHRLRYGLPLLVRDDGNPAKNTAAYHIVQHEKTRWLERAAAAHEDAEAFVWIDYGTFSQAGVNAESIAAFAERAGAETEIALPGMWDIFVPGGGPAWRFAGSSLAIHRAWTTPFHQAAVRVVRARLDRAHLDWEVNTWARLELEGELPMRWYAANHDRTQHDNYRPLPARSASGEVPESERR